MKQRMCVSRCCCEPGTPPGVFIGNFIRQESDPPVGLPEWNYSTAGVLLDYYHNIHPVNTHAFRQSAAFWSGSDPSLPSGELTEIRIRSLIGAAGPVIPQFDVNIYALHRTVGTVGGTLAFDVITALNEEEWIGPVLWELPHELWTEEDPATTETSPNIASIVNLVTGRASDQHSIIILEPTGFDLEINLYPETISDRPLMQVASAMEVLL